MCGLGTYLKVEDPSFRHFSSLYFVSRSDYKATYGIWEILAPFRLLVRDSGGSGDGDEGSLNKAVEQP